MDFTTRNVFNTRNIHPSIHGVYSNQPTKDRITLTLYFRHPPAHDCTSIVQSNEIHV